MAEAGRPTRMTEPVIEALCNAAARGATYRTAAGHAGISEATLYRWLREGEADQDAGVDSEHARFRQRWEKARADGDLGLLETVEIAAMDDPAMALRLLALRGYTPTQRTEARVEHAGTVDVGGDALREAIRSALREELDALPDDALGLD